MREEEAVLMGILVVAGVIALVMLAVFIFVCWFVSSCLQRIPEQYREQSPGMVWLLLVPCLNIIWVFMVYPKVAQSFQNYFNDNPDAAKIDVGDCGAQIAQFYCIAFILQVVPFLNYLATPASLVLLILTLVKFHTLKGLIPEGMA